jgi:hypothetical protein
MKYIITENRLNSIVTKWLDDNYGDLKIIQGNKSILNNTFLYFSNGNEIIFNYSERYQMVTIEDEILQNTLINMFDVDPKSLNKIFIPWVNKRYNLNSDSVLYTTWHCNKCGQYHHTKYHID